ncbi:MAG TPA: ribonuclease HIII [Firmicutes bacterium]|nr:ribonuclease HIII [Bacillota bacterium]
MSGDAPSGLKSGARIGLDESGKGDYFGPLVVGAVYADDDTDPKLREMGVRDSKRLTDKRITVLASEIKALCPYSVVVINPARYNQLYERFSNLNRLLAWAHARALENVLGKVRCDLAIADQFGDESFLINALLKRGRQVRLEQRPRAEADLAVAAASILARAEFVERIEQLSEQVGRPLPKGASNPDIIAAGLEIVREGGRAALGDVAKLHFRTTEVITSRQPES